MIEAFNYMQAFGVLPFGGGALDQPAALAEAMRIAGGERERVLRVQDEFADAEMRARRGAQ